MTEFINNRLLSSPLRMVASTLSPAGKNARLSIAIYHQVKEEDDELLGVSASAPIFDLQVEYFSKYFNVLPLHEAVQRLQDGTLPSRAACITFDDGYADNEAVALPILQKHGVSATFFVATGFINGGIMWNDVVIEWMRRVPVDTLDLTKMDLGKHVIETPSQRREALYSLINTLKYLPFETRKQRIDQLCSLIPVSLPDNLMMTSEQVIKLHRAGMGIGVHTVNHPILARLTNEAVFSEIAACKETLEQMINAPVRLFAYPNGKPGQDYLPDHIEIIKSLGFDAACTTAWGAAKKGCDLYQLPRFTPWDSDYWKFMLHMSRNMVRKVDVV
ncbi:MAG: polysaccharide deacetylase family protein [Nitrosomonas sp.]|nr:polysaccharide deacetylase family protein [Nitrosomonas sp.]